MKQDLRRHKKIIKALLKKEQIKVIGRRLTDVGTAWIDTREVVIPYITDIGKFLVCIHEIGHIINGWNYGKMSIHRCEFLTEKWTIRQAKRYKIDKKFPKEYRRYIIGAKRYVVHCCVSKGKDIPQYIMKWAKSKPSIEDEL